MSDLADFEGQGVRGAEEEREEEESRADPADSYVTVEISGLSVFTHHGVTQAEQDAGQRLVFDISLDVEDCNATVTDKLEDTIDYGAVCDAVIYVGDRALLQDARAALHRDRRHARRPFRRRRASWCARPSPSRRCP